MIPGRQVDGRASEQQPEKPAATAAPRRVGIEQILGSGREAIIDFNGAAYRLRITRNQRLILTK